MRAFCAIKSTMPAIMLRTGPKFTRDAPKANGSKPLKSKANGGAASFAKARKFGPYSKTWTRRGGWFGLTQLDPNTREFAILRSVHKMLSEYVGDPTITQKMLIDRAAVLSVRIAQIDRKILSNQELTVVDNNSAIAWMNALTRVLLALGVPAKRKLTPGLSLNSILREVNAA